MKKLLALILCVMMFVSVISTSAFADYDHADQRVWKGEGQNKRIVEALRTNIENMYGSYAVDNAVFSSIKSIDTIIKDLVDGMLDNYGTTPWAGAAGLTSSSTLNDAIVDGLRRTIGGQITDYISKHQNDYYRYDSMGNKVFNPSAYAGVYAKAASEALTSGKAVAGIQAYMMYCAQRSAFNTLANQAHDLENNIIAWDHWADYGFGDLNRGILTWHVPGTDIDGINDLDGLLHNINASYASVLSAMGQLGVDLNDDGLFGLGFNGWIRTADGTWAPSVASDNEAVNTPLLRTYFSDINKNGIVDRDGADAERTATIYENRTGTYYTDTTGNNIVDSLDDGTGLFTFGVQYRDANNVDSTTPYFVLGGDDVTTPGFFFPGVESALEVATDGNVQVGLNPELGGDGHVVTYAIQ